MSQTIQTFVEASIVIALAVAGFVASIQHGDETMSYDWPIQCARPCTEIYGDWPVDYNAECE